MKFYWQLPFENLYNQFFYLENLIGNLPYIFNKEEYKLDYQVPIPRCPLFIANYFLYSIFFFKHIILLGILHFKNIYPLGYELLVFWCAGSLFFFTLFVTTAKNRKEICVLFSRWLKFTKFAEDQTTLRMQTKIKKQRRIFWFQYLFYLYGGSLGGPFLVAILHLVYPRTPCFLYSILPEYIDSSEFPYYQRFLILAVLTIFETYMAVIGNSIILGTDLLSGLISKYITSVLSALTENLKVKSINSVSLQTSFEQYPQQFRVYTCVTILLNNFNSIYSDVILAAEGITLLLLVVIFFVSIHPDTNWLIRIVMCLLSTIVVVHTLTFCVPMANIIARSIEWKNEAKRKREIVSNAITYREFKTFPILKIRPGGIHSLTHSTILHIFLLFVGYLQLLFQI